MAFLDIKVSISGNVLCTSVHYKPTDSHSYLLYSSSHPSHVKNSIPYSKFLRLRRLCSDDSDFSSKSEEMCQFFEKPLMSRNAHDDKNGRFGERAARLTILAKLAILAISCQFRQISSSIGIATTRVNIGEFGDFGDFDKFGNFGDVLPISSN